MPIIDINNKEEIERYDEFLRRYSDKEYVSFTQTIDWMRIKEWDAIEIVYLERNNQIYASMGIVIKKLPIGKSVMYSPRGPVGDIKNLDILDKLMDEVKVLVKKYNTIFLKMDPVIEYNEEYVKNLKYRGYKIQCDLDKEYFAYPRFIAQKDFDANTEEELMKTFIPRTRQSIRAAYKKGLTVRWSRTKEDLDKFLEVYNITAERQHILKREKIYFEKILESIKDDERFRIYVVEHEGQVLSASIACKLGSYVEYMYAGSSNEKRKWYPNYLMIFEILKWGLETNAKAFSLGPFFTPYDENGLWRFKSNFTGKDGYIRTIGDIDKVYSRFWYGALNIALPLYKIYRNTVFYTKKFLKKIFGKDK